jgi:hypothetical protein
MKASSVEELVDTAVARLPPVVEEVARLTPVVEEVAAALLETGDGSVVPAPGTVTGFRRAAAASFLSRAACST